MLRRLLDLWLCGDANKSDRDLLKLRQAGKVSIGSSGESEINL